MARRRSFIKRTNKKNRTRTRNRTNKKNRTRNRINKKNRTKRINQKGGAFKLTLIVCLATLEENIRSVNSVAFHPTGSLLATGFSDGTAKLWSIPQLPPSSSDPRTPTCVATLNGNSGSVNSVAFHPTGSLLATGFSDGTVKLWIFRFSPDDSNVTMANLDGHSGSVNSVAFHPTASLLATGFSDGTAKLWSIPQLPPSSSDPWTPTCVATLLNGSHILSVAFHPTSPFLATGSFDGTAKLWRFRFSPDDSNVNMNCVAKLEGHASSVNSVAFHPTAPLLATGSNDKTMKLWNLSDLPHNALTVSPQPEDNPSSANAGEPTPQVVNNPVSIKVSQSGVVRSVAFHPKNGSLLATVDSIYTVKLWQLASDHQSAICVNTLENGGANSLAFHPTRPLLATGTYLTDANMYKYEELPPESDTAPKKCSGPNC